jgi:methionyl-tRNA formyltransferase
MKIIFLGTPEFAVPSLDILVKNGYDVVAVITVPDKPAGRGQKLQESDVKQYAVANGIKVLQPIKLSDPLFLDEVRALNADLQIVVAFRMMPVALWSMPKYGTVNLHGSLLPNYRGAAPINRAIMNGETETGVTTFFLKHEIDTGDIIFREVLPIDPNETAGELHDRMKVLGADLVLKTVNAIASNSVKEIPQSDFIAPNSILKIAPKIFKEDCKLDFTKSVTSLHNHIRGLSPFPGAYLELQQEDESIIPIKVFRSLPELAGTVLTHELLTDGKNYIKVSAADGFIYLMELQLPGKKRLTVVELLRGFKFDSNWTVL